MVDETGARVTTHVLDTSLGKPAAGIVVGFSRVLGGGELALLTTATTNPDGRCDAPLMEGEAFELGEYELTFAAGPYFEATGRAAREPKFLSDIVVRFGISERRHYHVPLLLSPFGYSTYRGS